MKESKLEEVGPGRCCSPRHLTYFEPSSLDLAPYDVAPFGTRWHLMAPYGTLLHPMAPYTPL